MSQFRSLVKSSRVGARSKLISSTSVQSCSTLRVHNDAPNDDLGQHCHRNRSHESVDVIADKFASWLVRASHHRTDLASYGCQHIPRPYRSNASTSIGSLQRQNRRSFTTATAAPSSTAALAIRSTVQDALSSDTLLPAEPYHYDKPIEQEQARRTTRNDEILNQSHGGRSEHQESSSKDFGPKPTHRTRRYPRSLQGEAGQRNTKGLKASQTGRQGRNHSKAKDEVEREGFTSKYSGREPVQKQGDLKDGVELFDFSLWGNKKHNKAATGQPNTDPSKQERIHRAGEIDAAQHRIKKPVVNLRESLVQSAGLSHSASHTSEVFEHSPDTITDVTGLRTNTSPQDAHAQRVHQYPLARRLVTLFEDDEIVESTPTRRALWPTSSHTGYHRSKLRNLLRRAPGHAPIQQIWESFDELDEPQVLYITDSLVRRMFTHLATVEYGNAPGERDRVLALYRQCAEANINLHLESYTTAMKYAGSGAKVVTSDHVKEAVEIWMQMENKGITADAAVFNVLHRSAVKAGRFALAQTLKDELQVRGLRTNRFMRCNLITGAGRRQDADGVRSEFTEFVNSGELVDTAVMNCVIRALLWADDVDGAEGMLDTMKTLHGGKFTTEPLRAWEHRRMLARSANKAREQIHAQQEELQTSFFGGLFTDKDRLQELQELMPVAPDATTYRQIISYHALKSGDLNRIRTLVAEMAENGFTQHVSMWHKIFCGFQLHKGVPNSVWTSELLEAVWNDFLALLSSNQDTVAKRERYRPVQDRAKELFTTDDTSSRTKLEVEHALLLHKRTESSHQGDRPLAFTTDLAQSIMKAWYLCEGEHGLNWIWTQLRREWRTMSTEERDMLSKFHSGLIDHLRKSPSLRKTIF